MEKRLYINEDAIFKSKEQTGEHVGGTYVARVQTGVEKDGSPQYRYFRSQAEYKDYLSRKRDEKKRGKKTKDAPKKDRPKGKGSARTLKEKLQGKLKQEQSKTRTQQRGGPSRGSSEAKAKRRSLFAGGAVKKSDETLYLGDIDVK